MTPFDLLVEQWTEKLREEVGRSARLEHFGMRLSFSQTTPNLAFWDKRLRDRQEKSAEEGWIDDKGLRWAVRLALSAFPERGNVWSESTLAKVVGDFLSRRRFGRDADAFMEDLKRAGRNTAGTTRSADSREADKAGNPTSKVPSNPGVGSKNPRDRHTPGDVSESGSIARQPPLDNDIKD